MEGNKKDPLSIKIAEMLKDKNYNVVSLLGIPNDGRYNYLKENLKKEDDKIEQSDFNKVDRLTQKIINTRLKKNDVLRNPNYWINPAKIAHKLAMKNIKYTNKLKSLLPEGKKVQPHLRNYLYTNDNEVTYNFSSQELISACNRLGVDFSTVSQLAKLNKYKDELRELKDPTNLTKKLATHKTVWKSAAIGPLGILGGIPFAIHQGRKYTKGTVANDKAVGKLQNKINKLENKLALK